MRKLIPFLCMTLVLFAEDFQCFTGKISGKNVRLRIQPNLESPVVKELKKGDLLIVTGQEGEFYTVRPSCKVYVAKRYIGENSTIEGERINIRLQPNVESPILGQLSSGDKIEGQLSVDGKWMEILPPVNIHFYVSKDFLVFAGEENFFSLMQQKKAEVEKLISSAYFLSQEEIKKPYDQMTPDEAISQFDQVIKNYGDFPESIQQAKEGLALLQDNYLQKKISYLESNHSLEEKEKEKLLAELAQYKQDAAKISLNKSEDASWETVEKSLYSSWLAFHPNKTQDEFYAEQKASGQTLSGTLEEYAANLKNRPGDFVLKADGKPVAFLYSTQVDLHAYLGKEITIIGSARPNHNFAFPAFFVHQIE